MANTFINVLYQTTNSLATVYTAPSATVAIVIGCQAANVPNTGTVALTMTVQSGATTRNLVKAVDIPVKASLAPIAGKLVLEAGDLIRASSAVSGDVDLVLSILEIT